jgi:hypothetical protein
MKKVNYIIVVFIFFFSTSLFSQSGQFNVEEYKSFLNAHQNMGTQALLEMHSAGVFEDKAYAASNNVLYLDSMELKFELTEYEKFLLNQHSFVVTERLGSHSFGHHLANIYHKDLPFFLSTDAILHAFHISYDLILKDIEKSVLIPQISQLLQNMFNKMNELEARYSENEAMLTMLKDIDIYLTVARKLLLLEYSTTYYFDNRSFVESLVASINKAEPKSYKLFSNTLRSIDFSQFKPRGHYADDLILEKYFKAMMWLGRIEFYLIPPSSADKTPNKEDMIRQSVDALLISELIDLSNSKNYYDEAEEIISFFVGEQDNVTLNNLRSLIDELNISRADELLNEEKFDEFQNTLKSKSYAFQQILSQILFSDPTNPDSIIPASAFLLFGQRFIPDSYVTGSVVFDRIIYNGQKIRRMLPSTLDILFAAGNDAAAQLLTPQLDEYKYASNLAALRYLLDSYDDDFWNSSIYNMWFNSIRKLNPPADRNTLPPFMRTAAWWQQKMNTQLASWAELRHDNLLYAKQSYSGGVICSYPYVYVEPIPHFYEQMKNITSLIKNKFENAGFVNEGYKMVVTNYFNHFSKVADTLMIIAEKELEGIPLSENENSFLQRILYLSNVCGVAYDGWYPRLYHSSGSDEDGMLKKDFIVADYHTAPTDASGDMVGWVAHAGTGMVDLAIITAELPGNLTAAFAGPVYSYHEYTTTNFLRLTDDEWEKTYLSLSLRPDWVNLYLADKSGNARPKGSALITSVDNDYPVNKSMDYRITAQNYPNPFNTETLINFNIAGGAANIPVEINVFDIRGRSIKQLLKKELDTGNYLVRWNGTNDGGGSVSSGIYLYEIKAGPMKYSGKMSLMK